MSKLNIPISKQYKGLYVFCNKCKSKSKTKLSLTNVCNHPEDKQVFRVIVTVPGTKSIRSQNLKTRDIDEAIKQTIDYSKELLANDYKQPQKNDPTVSKPLGLIDCIIMYLDYLENKNVYDHQIRIRSKAHINQINTYLQRFIFALKDQHIHPNGLLVRHVNDYHAGIFHSYIQKKYPNNSNRTFNRHMDTISEFFNYLIEIKHYELVNYFSSKNVARKRVHAKIETISMDEFKKLLTFVKRENGIEVLKDGTKKNHYYDWVKDAFELGLYTGRRREELMNMKFSDIHESDGKLIYIKSEDYKYNIKNNLLKKEEKKYNYTPIICDLQLFLQKIGYSKYKDTDRYLIAPNSLRKRETLKDDMSKAFTHFYAQLGADKNLEFRHLRKTYITMLNNHTNGAAEVITGQSGQDIIMRNYHDRKVFDDVILNFKLIS